MPTQQSDEHATAPGGPPRASPGLYAQPLSGSSPAAATEALRQNEALYRLTDRLHHALSLDQVYVAALDAILTALPCDRASILLFDADGVMRFVAWRGLSDDYRTAVEGHSPWSREASDPTPIWIEDVAQSDMDAELKAVICREGIGAAGFFPLMSGGRLIGKFMTYSDAPHAFGYGEVELSLTIARQLAFAIDRRRTDEALRASEQRLRTELADTQLLQRISAELIDHENLGALFESIVDAATAIMHSDHATLQALDVERSDGGELQLLACRGFDLDAQQSWTRISFDSRSVFGTALRGRSRVVVPDIDRDHFHSGCEHLAACRRNAVRALQSTPLFARSGRPVGMISTHWRAPHEPAERDLRLFDILARQAADLLERRRSTDELRSVKDRLAVEVEDLRRLHEFSTRQMRQPDLDSVMHELLTSTAGLLNAGQGSVQLYDAREDTLRLVGTIGLPAAFDEEFRQVPVHGPTTCAAAFRTAKRVIADDLNASTSCAELSRMFARYGIGAAQSTPLLDKRGTVVGMLTTYFQNPHAPSERELRLLDLYAEVAVRQIERRRSEEALTFLAELSAAFAPAGSAHDIARITSEMIRRHFGAARVNFLNVDDTASAPAVFDGERSAPAAGDGNTHGLLEYLSADAIEDLRAGHTIAISDVAADPRTAAHARAYSRWGTGSMLLAPHVSHGRWEFLLWLHRPATFRWRPQDSELLAEVAARVHIRLERARAEEALAKSEAKLREDDRRKDEFLAMLAHELRNPLAPIVNAVQLLGRSETADPLQQHVRAIIDRQAARLTRLVDDLLEVSRITSGRIQLSLERIALNGVVERAVESVRPLMETRLHELAVSLPDEPLWLHADATRLEQIVVNLLDNAAKYTDEGGRIEFSVWSGNGQAVLRVVDNGIGIERELLPRIFDLFTQSERSLDRSGGGLGIGLSLVQRLVQMHGGTVAVDSVVGRGSEFTVHLPLAAQPTQVAARPGVSRSSPLRALRVLVVDDNVDAAQSFGLLLEASGHDVRLAYDGDEALVAADEHRPEVIFLDIGLPKRDGYEVARRLRSQAAHRDVLLAAMTGYGQSSDRERSQAAGFDHHLVKPADFACVEPILASVASHGPAGGRKAKAEARVESVGGTVRSQETARDTAGRPAPAA